MIKKIIEKLVEKMIEKIMEKKNDNISPVRLSSFSTENEDMKRCLSV